MCAHCYTFHIHISLQSGFHTGFFAGGGKVFWKSKRPCKGVWGHSSGVHSEKFSLYVMLGGSGGMEKFFN